MNLTQKHLETVSLKVLVYNWTCSGDRDGTDFRPIWTVRMYILNHLRFYRTYHQRCFNIFQQIDFWVRQIAYFMWVYLVTVMLVTTLCWWFTDGDRFKMLVTESLCWRLLSLCWWFFQCIKSVTNILNLLPTHFVSNIRRQHQCRLVQLSVNNEIFTFCRTKIWNVPNLLMNQTF